MASSTQDHASRALHLYEAKAIKLSMSQQMNWLAIVLGCTEIKLLSGIALVVNWTCPLKIRVRGLI